jgi:cytochrome c oxidase subunit II
MTRRHGMSGCLLVATTILLSGCGGAQSTLDPHAQPARDISTLWWWMLAVAGTVLGGALFLLLLGWIRRREPGMPLLGQNEGAARLLVVIFGIAIPLGVNVALFVVANLVVAKVTEAPNTRTTPMTIHVVGHQWFWEVRYPGSKAVTANEIHIPVGTRVNLVATTDDVIHSFWVPQLNRKIDMIPGHPNRILLEADRPGRYRGQCAEFCGMQHAHMAMYVFADPPQRFRSWLSHNAAPRTPPSTQQARRGEQVFDQQACASCHTIRGTSAVGDIGPDLTHVGERTSLAALAIPNTRAELLRWIRDPQHVKPGNRMPRLGLPDPDFQSLADYLEGLK